MQFLISPLAYTTASLHQRPQTTNAFKGLTLQHHQEMDRHHPPGGTVKGDQEKKIVGNDAWCRMFP